jgi:hypothetical protein
MEIQIKIPAEILLPESKCRDCGYEMDYATSIDAGPSTHLPQAGDLSLCVSCGLPSIFDENLRLRALGKDEITELKKNDEIGWKQVCEASVMLRLLNPLTRKI